VTMFVAGHTVCVEVEGGRSIGVCTNGQDAEYRRKTRLGQHITPDSLKRSPFAHFRQVHFFKSVVASISVANVSGWIACRSAMSGQEIKLHA
jgi:hypothetical protein